MVSQSSFPLLDNRKSKRKKQRNAADTAVDVANFRKHPYGLTAVALPKAKVVKPRFEALDRSIYLQSKKRKADSRPKQSRRRVVVLHDSIMHSAKSRKVQVYPSDFTDITQLYGILDSGDERMKTMELREPLVQGECVPMQEWQTTFHPTCNGMHEVTGI